MSSSLQVVSPHFCFGQTVFTGAAPFVYFEEIPDVLDLSPLQKLPSVADRCSFILTMPQSLFLKKKKGLDLKRSDLEMIHLGEIFFSRHWLHRK